MGGAMGCFELIFPSPTDNISPAVLQILFGPHQDEAGNEDTDLATETLTPPESGCDSGRETSGQGCLLIRRRRLDSTNVGAGHLTRWRRSQRSLDF